MAAATFTTMAGAVYSVLLVLIYVPVFVIHERRIAQMADDALVAGAQIDRDEWLKTQGLHGSLSSMFASLIALASPWLTSLVTLFLK